MNYHEFTEKRGQLKITIDDFAKIIEYTPDAIKKWKQKENIPKWAEIVLEHLLIKKQLKCSL